MLKCKKVEKLFPLDQMVVKRLCNNVAENLKKFSRRDKCCPRDYAIIGKKKIKKFSRRDRRCHCDNVKIFAKTISALSNVDNARIVK